MDTKRLTNWATQIPNKPWFPFLALTLITVLATALRFFKLGEWSFWIDEIFTINHAQAHYSSLDRLLDNIPPNRNWVPISVILTAQALNIFGVSEWSARLVSAVIGILTIPILYFPMKKIFGNQVTLIALLLLAVSPWHIFWSQNARFYTSLMLLYTLAILSFYQALEQDKLKYSIIFLLLVYLATSERLLALLIYPAIASYIFALWILRLEKPKGYNIRNFFIFLAPILLGAGIELFSLIVAGESRFFGDFKWFTQYQIDDPFRLLVFSSNNVGVPIVVMAIFSGLYLLKTKKRSGILFFLGAVSPLILLVVANLLIFTKDRYMFITIFCWVTTTSVGIYKIYKHSNGIRWLALGFLFVFVAHASNDMILYYKINNGNRLDWNNAFSFVQERIKDDDVIVSFWPEFGTIYLDREIISYEDVSPDEILRKNNKYWFVLDSETIWTNGKLKVWIEDNAQLLDVKFLRRPEESYIKVYSYDPTPESIP